MPYQHQNLSIISNVFKDLNDCHDTSFYLQDTNHLNYLQSLSIIKKFREL